MEIWHILLVGLLNGISFGMLLFLIASGLSLALGVMGYFNLAHGALYMVGAVLGLAMVALGAHWSVSLVVAGLGSGLIGLLVERGLLSRLYKQVNEQVLVTVGVIYVLSNIVLWAWGPYEKGAMPPPSIAGAIHLGDISFPSYRLVLILIGLAFAVGLWWLQDKTKTGAIVRAGMDDREMIIGLGVNYRLVSSGVFFLGAVLAGLAGIIGAPIMGAHFLMSLNILLLGMIVVIVGGVGSVQGALIGAIVIGLVDSFGKAFFPEMAMFYVYGALIIILLFRPTGLLGKAKL